MEGAVIIAFMKFVETYGETQPNNPAFQIGLVAVKNQVMGTAEFGRTNGPYFFEIGHLRVIFRSSEGLGGIGTQLNGLV